MLYVDAHIIQRPMYVHVPTFECKARATSMHEWSLSRSPAVMFIFDFILKLRPCWQCVISVHPEDRTGTLMGNGDLGDITMGYFTKPFLFAFVMLSGVSKRSNAWTWTREFSGRPEAVHCWKTFSAMVFQWIMHKIKPLNCAFSEPLNSLVMITEVGASTSACRTGSCALAVNDGTPLL